MHKSNRTAFTNITQILLDILCLVAAYALTESLTALIWEPMPPERFLWVLLSFALVFFFVMNSLSMYTRTTFMYRDRVVRVILSSSLCGAGFCLCILPFVYSFNFQNKFLGIYILISTFLLIVQRLASMHFLRKSGKRSELHCLAIGDPDIISRYRYYMR